MINFTSCLIVFPKKRINLQNFHFISVGKKLENAESLVTSSMKIVLELYRSEIEKLPKVFYLPVP